MAEIENTDENFAELFEASLKKKRRVVRPGERVSGSVVSVGEKRVLLDLGDGLDGMMELAELAPPGEKPSVKVGDTVEGYALRVEEGLVELGRTAGKGLGARRALEDAAQNRLPVEGVVAEVNKGGYVVEIGGTRCFCPMGQMDIRRIEDPTTMVGQKLLFKVAEFRAGKDVVLSRRAILEEEQAGRAAATRKNLAVGARFTGTVTNVRDFGAFVDIGGVEGLIPVSELGYGRVKAQDAVRPGQQVEVEVLRMEPGKDGKERISLSMRALAADPFQATVDQLAEGAIVAGTVTRVQPFGAFVELVPGVEGMIHVSAFGKRVGHPSEMVKEGQPVVVRVSEIDDERRRIALTFINAEEAAAAGWDAAAPATGTGPRVLGRKEIVVSPEQPTRHGIRPDMVRPAAPAIGTVVDVTVDKVESFGVFVKWDQGRGLVPGVELGVPRNTELRKIFPVGTVFRAVVQEIRPDGKIKLSKTEVEKAEERAEHQAYMARSGTGPGAKGFGTLGDLLKAKSGK